MLCPVRSGWPPGWLQPHRTSHTGHRGSHMPLGSTKKRQQKEGNKKRKEICWESNPRPAALQSDFLPLDHLAESIWHTTCSGVLPHRVFAYINRVFVFALWPSHYDFWCTQLRTSPPEGFENAVFRDFNAFLTHFLTTFRRS